MYVKQIGSEDVERIHLTQDKVQWWAVLKTATKLHVP
jgi:hypothetical protein